MIKGLFNRQASESTDTTVMSYRYDRVLLGVTLCLMALGAILVYSASIVSAEAKTGDGAFFLRRQLAYIFLAIGAMGVGMNLHHDIFRRLSKPIFAGAVILLILVLIPQIAVTVKGASRWIALGPIRLQPSEVAKLSWLIILSWFLSTRQDRLDDWKTAWGLPMGLLAVIGVLLMAEPDFGSTLICAGMMVLMVWAAGGKTLHVCVLGLIGCCLIVAAVMAEPYRLKRLQAFFFPENDTLGVSYHINQALISFASGGWQGLGLGESRQKLMYLPEAHTDFIFSILGEELGLIGVAIIVGLFATFVWRGFAIARRSPSAFGSLLAYGITAQVGFQAVTNMAVATALVPTKGLTLPFISYGGSSLLTVGLAVGILLNISRCEPPPAWMHRLLPDGAAPKAKKRARGHQVRRPA